MNWKEQYHKNVYMMALLRKFYITTLEDYKKLLHAQTFPEIKLSAIEELQEETDLRINQLGEENQELEESNNDQ